MSRPTTTAPDVDASDQSELPALLDRAAELGEGRLTPGRLAEVVALRDRVQQRLARGDALTVVALVGGTGVGKSALVNRLVGADIVPTGVRRPTTDHPVAVRSDTDAPTTRLLDWLDIADRRPATAALPEGLIVVDLPDHDSVATSHRTTAARLVSRVDAVVVVVDPLKYARADLHDGPLAALVSQASLVTVALNRIDELPAPDVDRCLADLAARLATTGHEDVEVVPTSAATGEGVDELRARLTTLAATRTAAQRRLEADAARLAGQLEAELPDVLPVDEQPADVAGPLLELTGGTRRCDAAELAYRADAHRATRSYGSRIVRRIASMGRTLTRDRDGTAPPRRGGTDPGRPPLGTAVAPAVATLLASRSGLDGTTAATHTRLSTLIEGHAASLAPQLTEVVETHDPRPTHRAWWSAMSLGHTIAEATALTGLIWLLLLRTSDWLGLPELPVPWVTDRLSLPAALVLGGLTLRLVGGGLTRWLRRVGTRRHRARLGRRIAAGQRAALDRLDVALREEHHRDVELRRLLRQLRDTGDRPGSAALP